MKIEKDIMRKIIIANDYSHQLQLILTTIKFADCRKKNTTVGYIRITVISIKREMAATEKRIPDNISRSIS